MTFSGGGGEEEFDIIGEWTHVDAMLELLEVKSIVGVVLEENKLVEIGVGWMLLLLFLLVSLMGKRIVEPDLILSKVLT